MESPRHELLSGARRPPDQHRSPQVREATDFFSQPRQRRGPPDQTEGPAIFLQHFDMEMQEENDALRQLHYDPLDEARRRQLPRFQEVFPLEAHPGTANARVEAQSPTFHHVQGQRLTAEIGISERFAGASPEGEELRLSPG